MSAVRKQSAPARPGVVDPWMSLREAAKELGCAPATVSSRALRGELETQTVAGRVFVSRKSVERAKAVA